MNMFVTHLNVTADIAVRLVPPHEAEMILSDYRREVGMFQPESVKISWSQLSNGTTLFPAAEVSGRRTIKRGARARVQYDEGEDSDLDHWPLYVRDAWRLARQQVRR